MQGFSVKNLRDFSRLLFVEETFDAFLVPEACFVTGFTASFDGRVPGKSEAEDTASQVPGTEAEPYICWRELKPLAQDLVRGKSLPRSFSIVFMLSRAKTRDFLEKTGSSFTEEQVSGLYLNVRFSREQLSLTTGCALSGFSLDRSLEQAWDRQIGAFLARIGVQEA